MLCARRRENEGDLQSLPFFARRFSGRYLASVQHDFQGGRKAVPFFLRDGQRQTLKIGSTEEE